jgi:endonuclease
MTIANVLGAENTIEESDFSEIGFALESHLRDFIVKNLNTIDVQGRKLRLYTGENGQSGVEFVTPAGIIDILTVDQDGAFFVFELKRSRSPDHAIGQLARYMGWLRKTIGAEKAVHGLIVAKEITDNLRYAAIVMPNVSLFEYEVQFQLKLAQEFPP